MNKTRATRLTKHLWIETGLSALAADGPSALRAEPLSRRLGTTKGSFYWHFADLPTYQAALIERWEELAISEVAHALADEQTVVGRLRRFAQIIADRPGHQCDKTPIEPAMRAWALSDGVAAEAVRRVDAKRLTYLTDLLGEIGVSNPEMARIIYGASLGLEQLSPTDRQQNASAMGSLVDLILALR